MSLLHITKYQNDDAFSLDGSVQDSAIENNVFRIVSASVHYTAVLQADNDGVWSSSRCRRYVILNIQLQ